MTLDTSEMVAQWREAIARGGHRAYSVPVVEMVVLLDALEAERERVRVLTEYAAVVCEAVAMERRTLEDSLDADHWIGYATPLAAIARIEAALATAGGEGAKT